jgi:hypothetical protein
MATSNAPKIGLLCENNITTMLRCMMAKFDFTANASYVKQLAAN